jgi:hypothetical protein
MHVKPGTINFGSFTHRNSTRCNYGRSAELLAIWSAEQESIVIPFQPGSIAGAKFSLVPVIFS